MMGAVDDLKNGTGGNPRHTTIDLSSLANKNSNGGARKTINMAEAVKQNSTDGGKVQKTEGNQTYIQSILDTENPNSDFMKHVAEKSAEAQKWIAEQEEKAVLEAEAAEVDDDDEDEDENMNSNGVVIDTVAGTTNVKEEDLSNPEMTEGEDLSGHEMVTFDLTGGDDGDDEESEEVETEEVTEEAKEEVAEEAPAAPAPEEPKKEEPPKKEMFTAPEIDVEVTQEEVSSIDEKSGDEEDDIRLDDTEEGSNDEYDRLRSITTERLKPASLNLNLSSFTIAKKPKANVSGIFQAHKAKISKWVLFNQKCTVAIKEFSGSELEMMMEYYQASRRSADAMRRMLRMIYDHIASPKPTNFDTWLKVTPYSDIDNYFFAIYLASFNGANYIPIDCSGDTCKKSYITENINVMDSMVKFDSEEKKKEFMKIYQAETPLSAKGLYTTEVVALTDKVAIGFKEPSLWDRIEIDSIDTDTANEFSSIIGLIPYIDQLYIIDLENSVLTPITYKEFPENPQRTTRSKIKKYNSIFNSLTVDEFTPVKAYVSALLDKTSRGVNYVIPETTCPECGHVNPETPIGNGQVADMVFTRCQLGALVTTSIN